MVGGLMGETLPADLEPNVRANEQFSTNFVANHCHPRKGA